jgi:hypothetical protein
MPTHSLDFIRPEEISTVFSDSTIAAAIKHAGLRLEGVTLKRFAGAVRAMIGEYAAAARRPTPNTVRREIEALAEALDVNAVPDGRDYDNVKRAWAALSDDARQILERRLDRIRQMGRSRLEARAAFSKHRVTNNDLRLSPNRRFANLEMPAAVDLEDPERRDHAFDVIFLVVVTGRDDGKLCVHAPLPSRSEPRREAERDIVLSLVVAWAVATGREVTTTGRHDHHYRERSIVVLVAELLRLARVPVPVRNGHEHDHDRQGLAVEIMNGLAAVRGRRLTEDALRQELQQLGWEHDLIDEARRQLELGKATVVRVAAGAEPDLDPREPAIVEFDEVGTICFYCPPFGWWTVAVKPFPRDRIMRLAEQLAEQNERTQHQRQRRRRARERRAANKPRRPRGRPRRQIAPDVIF